MDVRVSCHWATNQILTMKVYTLKSFFLTLAIACIVPSAYAQFDDVYYDPDQDHLSYESYTDDQSYGEDTGEVTYYDNDEYEYFDDYDYYYSSRIRRFHRPYTGFDFYDPYYVSYNYYDPYYNDSYYYPGSTIYISFGADYWDYRNWRRWQRWNRWNSFYAWHSPASYYYSYNSWCAPSHHYWGGYHSYHSYSNYYNNYYNSCPLPVSHYYGITHSTVNNINTGGTRGTYYGPRISGNTGSSPRGTGVKPENVQPVFKGVDGAVSRSNDTPAGTTDKPVRSGVPSTEGNSVKPSPSTDIPATRNDDPVVREIPVDKELPRETPSGSKRPVFRPDSEKYQPYPSNRTNDKSGEGGAVRSDSPQSKPSAPPSRTFQPRPSDDGQRAQPPVKTEERPSYTPPSRSDSDRPAYTPPPRNERPAYTPPSREERPTYNAPPREERNESRPSYTPPPRNERSEDRPSYSPPPRSNDSGRSNDRPSYNPPPQSRDSGNSSPSPRGSSSGGNSSSPRSPGRG